jgi:hypothetical protein
MKTLLTIFAALLMSIAAPAQYCELTAEISCTSQLKATAPVANPLWVAQLTSGSSVIETAAVQPDGVTFFFATTLSDTTEYALQYHNGTSLGCGYSTHIGLGTKGKIITGCVRWNYCLVGNIGCDTTQVQLLQPSPKKKRGK